MSRWGPEGPPAEAYSRVTRDLATVFGGLHEAVDERVTQLVGTHGAVTRPLRHEEVARLRVPLQRSVVVLPPNPAASPLLIGFTDRPGVVIAAGDWAGPWYGPTCECDACDADCEMSPVSGWARYSWRDAKRHDLPRGWRRRKWAPWRPASGRPRDVGSTA